MKLAKGSVSVWPGYVAAISCLVLSLLLLASIIVAIITQLGTIAANYKDTLVVEALKKFSYPGDQMTPGGSPAQASAVALVLLGKSPPPPVLPPQLDLPQLPVPQDQLRLVFGSTLFAVPAAQEETIAKAIAKLASPAGVRWRIWAAALESDELNKRTTFQIMTSVRGLMARSGTPESAVELRILPLRKMPAGSVAGEVVIYIAPLSIEAKGGPSS